MKLFFPSTFGSISGTHLLISLLARVTYAAGLPPTNDAKCAPFSKVFINGNRRTPHGVAPGEQGEYSINWICFDVTNVLNDMAA
jgi:hypothetical protein